MSNITYFLSSGNITYRARGTFDQVPDCKNVYYKVVPLIESKWANGSDFQPSILNVRYV